MTLVYTPERIEMCVESVIEQLAGTALGYVGKVGIGNDSDAAEEIKLRLERRGYHVETHTVGRLSGEDQGTKYLLLVMYDGVIAHA